MACLPTWRQSQILVPASVVLCKTSMHRLQNSQVRPELFVLCPFWQRQGGDSNIFVSFSTLGVHTLLRKLQFLFELPARLNKCLELQAFAQAVRSHRRARCVLQQYSHLPSFKGIQDDCHAIMDKLAQELRQKFR